MKIQNPKTNVPTGIELNDKDYMNRLLSCLKEIEKNYATALTEASNETLYKEIKNFFDKYATLQREVYEEMFRNGWYQLESVDTKKVTTKYDNIKTKLQDLNN